MEPLIVDPILRSSSRRSSRMPRTKTNRRSVLCATSWHHIKSAIGKGIAFFDERVMDLSQWERWLHVMRRDISKSGVASALVMDGKIPAAWKMGRDRTRRGG